MTGHVDVLACPECPRMGTATVRGGGRTGQMTQSVDEAPALAFYCPECGDRELRTWSCKVEKGRGSCGTASARQSRPR